ncbi:MAG: uL15m family ribosomal protein [Planctomycetota bacterium]
MNTKKRKKVSRMRGSHTHGRGFKKKARGSGHRGGVGLAGTGKRADHKKNIKLHPFGKSKTLRKKYSPRLKVINLRDIQKTKREINLKGYKILSLGEVKEKLTITASAASSSAIDKVKKAGGDIIIKK